MGCDDRERSSQLEALDGQVILDSALARSKADWLEEAIVLMSGAGVAETDIGTLANLVRQRPLLLPDPLVLHMAAGDNGRTAAELVVRLEASRLRPKSDRERRACRLLHGMKQSDDPIAPELLAMFDNIYTPNTHFDGRRRLVAVFFMARAFRARPDSRAGRFVPT